MKNLEVVLTAAGSDWKHVLHCRIYLTDFSRYAEVNDAHRRWFPSGKLPARTCIGVTGLAAGADVESDLLAAKRSADARQPYVQWAHSGGLGVGRRRAHQDLPLGVSAWPARSA